MKKLYVTVYGNFEQIITCEEKKKKQNPNHVTVIFSSILTVQLEVHAKKIIMRCCNILKHFMCLILLGY